MSVETRTYTKKRRAELEEATRQKITESTVALHQELGPTRTSISAIAERAGVRRSTVYRHFPDEMSLFVACSGHWMQLHPLPDLEAWAAIDDPDERLRVGLGELYGRYRRTERMTENLFRDERIHDVTRELFSQFHEYVGAAQGVLMAGRGLRGKAKRRVDAAVGHALAFSTWKSLAREQELGDDEAVELMCRLVAAAG